MVRVKNRIEEKGFLHSAGFNPLPGFIRNINRWLSPECFALVMQEEVRRQIAEEFRRLGFRFATLDVEGFRSGSFD